jgi:hypothetical protein
VYPSRQYHLPAIEFRRYKCGSARWREPSPRKHAVGQFPIIRGNRKGFDNLTSEHIRTEGYFRFAGHTSTALTPIGHDKQTIGFASRMQTERLERRLTCVPASTILANFAKTGRKVPS